jgi:predicted DsbA family dithiol-disulfide isomerase
VRLSEVEQGYRGHVEVHWRAFPLIAVNRPGRRASDQTRESRRRAQADEPRAVFELPAEGTELPASSVPALTAAKAAERQGAGAFDAFHHRLFAAHFRDNLDISRADVLGDVAGAAGLDLDRFRDECASGDAYRAVLHDYAEAVAWFGVSALPTAIFNEKISLVGAVPVDRYRLLIEWMLAGEPGGVIPLDFGDPAPTATGRSAAGQTEADSA